MVKKLVNSEARLEEAHHWLDEQWEKNKYFWLNATVGKRSLDQNALSHHWYTELSEQGDMTTKEYRNYCKYHHGVPILAQKDVDLGADLMIKLGELDYQRRIDMMQYISVTSTFDRKEMTEYLDCIQREFIPQGFRLTTSEDLDVKSKANKK